MKRYVFNKKVRTPPFLSGVQLVINAFENCHIKAQKGLSISNVANVNFKGLELEIKEGEKIYERSANKDK